MVPQILNSVALEVHAWVTHLCMRARPSWLLLLLVTISVVSMPVTQHLWAWDRYLHGGQDFETGVFLILISFCLMIVLARSCKSCLARFLSALRVLSRFRARAQGLCLAVFPSLEPILNGSSGDGYSLPLQI